MPLSSPHSLPTQLMRLEAAASTRAPVLMIDIGDKNFSDEEKRSQTESGEKLEEQGGRGEPVLVDSDVATCVYINICCREVITY